MIQFMMPLLDNSQRQLFLGRWALELGDNGARIVSDATGADEETIRQGIALITEGLPKDARNGGGTSSSGVPRKANAQRSIQRTHLLPKHHRDYDEQMRHISLTVDEYLECGDPIIFLERTVMRSDDSVASADLDAPHADPGAIAGAAVLEWWATMGESAFPNADRIYVLIPMKSEFDGPSMQRSLAALANEAGLAIEVSLVPPLNIRWIDLDEQLTYVVEMNEGVGPIGCVVSLVLGE